MLSNRAMDRNSDNADAIRLDIDVTRAAPALGEAAYIAANILIPPGGQTPLALLACIPGGGMNRRYFDLPTPPDCAEASFARAMAARGYAVAWLDPLGIGESTIPRDPYLLDPDLMAATNGQAAASLLEGLRKGTLLKNCPAWPQLRSIGVGHSYGALLTIIQQSERPMHIALAVFGFHTNGLPDYVSPEDAMLDPAVVRANIVAMTRARQPEPYYALRPSASKQPVSADVAMQPLLVTMTLMSRLPNMIAKDAASIDVPLFLAFGDKDLHKDVHSAPASYTACNDITFLVLPDTRHNHFVYPSRSFLFERFARWASGVLENQ
jgi:pimeloyl-ACP methyl ester carboxylesterase